MTDTQKDVEQFRKHYLQHQGYLVEQNFYALLRRVVEECCETVEECWGCFRDHRKAHGNLIRRNFAWLEEDK